MIDLTEFVPIEEFPTYLINKRGDVYSTKSNKLIKPGRKSKHVRTQTICLDGSKHYVHRVVAKTFIPNPLNLPSVKHIDGNVDNNAVENLLWYDNTTSIKPLPTQIDITNYVTIQNYELYKIDMTGNVYCVRYDKLVKTSISKDGYNIVRLLSNGKYYNKYVHMLVANEFVDNINKYNLVTHIDGDKLNNNHTNLKWYINEPISRAKIHKYIDTNGYVPIKNAQFPTYLINEIGVVFSTTSKRFTHPIQHGDCMCVSMLTQSGKYKLINSSTLVAQTFIPNPNNYNFIIYKDGNRFNVHKSNLQWSSIKFSVTELLDVSDYVTVSGYDGYLINKNGNVYSIETNTIIKPYYSKGTKLLKYNLSLDSSKLSVSMHILLAKAFIPNPNNYTNVQHVDGNRLNNNIDNLKWISNNKYIDGVSPHNISKYELSIIRPVLDTTHYLNICNDVYEFKSIPEFSNYKVNKIGNVIGRRNTVLKYRWKEYKINTYIQYILKNDDGEYVTVGAHRLVALTYIENPFNYKEINHIDGCKYNNFINNLEWCSHLMNMTHASIVLRPTIPEMWKRKKIIINKKRKLSNDNIQAIQNELNESNITKSKWGFGKLLKSIASRYNVCSHTIRLYINNGLLTPLHE